MTRLLRYLPTVPTLPDGLRANVTRDVFSLRP